MKVNNIDIPIIIPSLKTEKIEKNLFAEELKTMGEKLQEEKIKGFDNEIKHDRLNFLSMEIIRGFVQKTKEETK